jgi:hypothetical protein
VPTFRIEAENGTWLTDERLNGFDWRAGVKIHRGPGDTLEVLEVRDAPGEDKPVLVVRSSQGQKSA